MIDTTTGGSSETLSFAQFDPALGTLTSVSVELAGSANALYAVFTNSTTGFTTSGTSNGSLQLSGTGFSTQSTPTLTASTTNGSVMASPSASQFAETYFPGTPSTFDLFSDVANTGFANYVGTGSASVNAGFSSFTTNGSTNNPAGTTAGVGGGGQANGMLTVTYDYTPVPLPTSLPLFLSALIGFVFILDRCGARRVKFSVENPT